MTQTELLALFDHYHDLVYRLALSYTGSIPDAEDVVQTVFLKLLQATRGFDSQEHERAWIIRTAVNLCKDHLKSRWRRTTVTLDTAENVPAPQPEEGSLLAALDLLPPKYRTVIYLYYYEGYSAREIAALLGEKPATVFTRLDRGRQKLRTYLEQEELT